MQHRVFGTQHIVTLERSESFVVPGDRPGCWPTKVVVVKYDEQAEYLTVMGYRDTEQGSNLQPTSEALFLNSDEWRVNMVPKWLREILVWHACAPTELIA